jgi:poly(3-hydroxybutyrate) depolymerase
MTVLLGTASFLGLISGSVAQEGSAVTPQCAFQKIVGRQQGARCHGISYDLTVPPQCLNGTQCGVVVDVHGGTMNGTWEEALTQMAGLYAPALNLITLQPSASLLPPPMPSWGLPTECAKKCLAGLDDVKMIFDVDKTRFYFGGSSQGGMCTNAVMNGPRASEFAAFSIAAAYGNIPRGGKKSNFLWYAGRHDTFSGMNPRVVEPQIAKFRKAWGLTEHSLVDSGNDFERHSYTDPSGSVEIQYLVHNYTLAHWPGGVSIVAGHCAPGGIDAPPHQPFAHIMGLTVRLSCPQPDPKKAEPGSWAGHVDSTFYKKHQLKVDTFV